MKKLLSAVMIGIITLELLPIHSFAADITQDSSDKRGEINVNYDMDTEYTVTIPASVTFSESEKTVERPLQAAGVRIEDGKSLNITISSLNDFKMKYNENDDSYIEYRLMINYATIPEGNNFTVLTVKAGEGSGWAILSFITELNKDKAFYTGNYTDTITFTVSVD